MLLTGTVAPQTCFETIIGAQHFSAEEEKDFLFGPPEEQEFSLVLMMSSCFVGTWCSDTDGGVGRAVCDHGVLTVFKH